eukprot:CAMPEP_0119312490 /NCGR_PEP_ID=MMETSP1333-20130426/26647_1 /TAXON_ID=418940 /ORGANISM="Scyphosphaera apsteinii, Strain RCC1455" /LENGTH=99 /DNA_ID=CAMNT_0007317119 /DNA_START=42 /DNA_END=341 /DNA_ORIENTATION=+
MGSEPVTITEQNGITNCTQHDQNEETRATICVERIRRRSWLARKWDAFVDDLSEAMLDLDSWFDDEPDVEDLSQARVATQQSTVKAPKETSTRTQSERV